jgi:DNA-binding NarL/FixJ family response regulator
MELASAIEPVALVVDDHDAVRRALCDCISASLDQVRTREASNAEDALRIVDKEWVDLVVIDIRLPGMNGIECTRAIRRLSPMTRVVVVSKYDDAPHRNAATDAGASAYVCKREVSRDLIPALERILRRRGGAKVAAA